MPIPRAIIDADVLYRRHPRNLLVWHALAGLFELHWSTRILDETRRHLVERNVTKFSEARAEAVDRTLRRVTDALEQARSGSLIPEAEVVVHEPRMLNDPKDRHVLAAAVAVGATVVITTNVRDFAIDDGARFRIAPQTPDDFLTSLLDDATVDPAVAALRDHASFHGWTVATLLELLATGTPERPAIAPTYAARIQELIGRA
ncbi:MAG TPA: PIN domain-containing protein [Conexibacter sp.]